jgi:hypothetical protein
MLAGMLLVRPSHAFPQDITNQLMVWALLNAVITVVINLAVRGPRPRFNIRWGASIGIALLSVGVGYAALMVCDFLFKVDFRFWVVALKLLSPAQFGWFLRYLIPFTAYFVVALGALHSNLAVKGEGALAQYTTAVVALAGGFLLFLLAQYVPLFAVGQLPVPAEALNAIVSIQFLPLLTIVAVIAVFAWRRTNSFLPGAFICGLFVTWYIVAGTAVQFAG